MSFYFSHEYRSSCCQGLSAGIATTKANLQVIRCREKHLVNKQILEFVDILTGHICLIFFFFSKKMSLNKLTVIRLKLLQDSVSLFWRILYIYSDGSCCFNIIAFELMLSQQFCEYLGHNCPDLRLIILFFSLWLSLCTRDS